MKTIRIAAITSALVLAHTLLGTGCAEDLDPPRDEAVIDETAEPAAQVDVAPETPARDAAGAESRKSGFHCGWQVSLSLYDQTNFRGEGDHLALASCACEELPPWYVDHLYSARTGTTSEVCWFYTGRRCDGASQCLDSSGYRNMAHLPAYHSVHCMRTDDGDRDRCPG
jgi:hypothetical protein